MAVGLTELPPLLPIDGVRLGSAQAGVRYKDRADLAVMEIVPGSTCAAVFTRNRFRAAPVLVAERHLQRATPRYLLINAGNANAGTGETGIEDAIACCRVVAKHTGCENAEVLPFSTGVIGERLPVARFEDGIPVALDLLSADGWADAAAAIMTTDTVAKGASRRVTHAGKNITVTGIAKGSGMICPDMATLLVYVATDAAVGGSVLQQCLREAMDVSFNCITVDGDTSTNDVCVLVATGRGEQAQSIDSAEEGAYEVLSQAVREVCTELAQAVVRDGEGATKFVTITVRGGRSRDDCREVAYTIAHSPLVKTALFASDPNWGRILAAVGRANIDELMVDRVSLYLDDVCIATKGGVDPKYREEDGQRVMDREEFTIGVDLGQGSADATIWTSDLSHGYVTINAEYRS